MSSDLLDVVRRCRGGEADAWRTLLPTFQEIGRRALRSFRLSRADLDDVLGDALTSLYAGGLSQFRGATIAELVAFLRTVTRNRALDFVKERNRWAPSDALDQSDESTTGRAGGARARRCAPRRVPHLPARLHRAERLRAGHRHAGARVARSRTNSRWAARPRTPGTRLAPRRQRPAAGTRAESSSVDGRRDGRWPVADVGGRPEARATQQRHRPA